ncbi:Protein monoglycylase ttll8 [Phytophthora boehmeriae]|uniref:Protein monoglycylase ttll8 n=1 Tax=Phytophthora boehmeriae TaxID=109152 RepID=A0A8T1X4B6_9STRA|nr:Protein monoglycylase ttll8 [Phytophthora boehmeriae]
MSSSSLPDLQVARAKSPSLGLLPPLVNDAARTGNNQKSRLPQPRQRSLPSQASSSSSVKFPAIGKPVQQQTSALPKCNQDEEKNSNSTKERDDSSNNNEGDHGEEENKRHSISSSRTGASSRSSLSQAKEIKDKNRDYIKELEDKKRKEKEDRARHERRKKKLHEKRTRKILQDAADAKRKLSSSPEVDDLKSELSRQDAEPQEEEDEKEVEATAAEKRKEKAKRQKRLLKKQQAHLAKIQAKQREMQEELEMEKEREQRKLEKVTQTVLNAIQDSNNRSAENAGDADNDTDGSQRSDTTENGKAGRPERNEITPRETAPPPDEQTEEQKQRAKEQREAFQRKQQEYLQKLTDQRKQKQREDEEARLRQEKRNKKIQQEAKLRLQEAASKQQALAEIREKEEAEAAAAAAEKAANAGPPVDVEAMVARLSKLKARDAQIIPEARDFASWKKRHGVGQDQKVFCMTGWYPVIREELEKRGWFYNQEKISPYFDLKWSLKSDELRHFKVEKYQYVNHFFQNAAITTKVGLIHNLRSAIWHHSVDIDGMFPRAYDLNDPSDMDSFIQDFRYGVAEGLLKEFARRGLQLQNKVPGSTSIGANEALVDVVLNIARKKVKSKRPEMNCANTAALLDPLEESVDDPLSTGVGDLVTDLQWEVLTNCTLDKPGHLRASLVYKKKVYADDKTDGAGDAKGIATVPSAREKRLQRLNEKIATDAFNREKARLSDLMAHVSLVKDTTFDEAIRLARELENLCPQFHINGGAEFMLPTPHPVAATSVSKNVWIVKPAGMSRGRGIRVFNDLGQLLEYVDVENHKECQWIAQKYIENPLLLCRRKFDIRQWVLVTGWDPLTVWFNEDCYLRFSSEEYSMDDLSDQYVHLTNNSIQKYSDKFNDVYATDDGEMQVEGNMWHSDDFKKFIATKLGQPDIWNERMHPRMKEVVVQSLQCVQDMVQHRSNSCELFGYDFMVDEQLTPWLIEVNSSPACDYSTPIAQRYVESGLAGIIKVIVDHREFEQQKRNGVALEEPDTGCWKRIHKADFIGKPISSIALDFQVKGSKVQRSRRSAQPNNGKSRSKMAGSGSTTSVTSVQASETDGRAESVTDGDCDDAALGIVHDEDDLQVHEGKYDEDEDIEQQQTGGGDDDEEKEEGEEEGGGGDITETEDEEEDTVSTTDEIDPLL